MTSDDKKRAQLALKWSWPIWTTTGIFLWLGTLSLTGATTLSIGAAMVFSGVIAFTFIASMLFVMSTYLILEDIYDFFAEVPLIEHALITLDITEVPEKMEIPQSLIVTAINGDSTVMAKTAGDPNPKTPERLYAQAYRVLAPTRRMSPKLRDLPMVTEEEDESLKRPVSATPWSSPSAPTRGGSWTSNPS